jgi:hypothetical protein
VRWLPQTATSHSLYFANEKVYVVFHTPLWQHTHPFHLDSVAERKKALEALRKQQNMDVEKGKVCACAEFFFFFSFLLQQCLHGDELLNEIAGKIERKPPEVPAAADRNMDPLHEGLAK